jgi:hypothetical protein
LNLILNRIPIAWSGLSRSSLLLLIMLVIMFGFSSVEAVLQGSNSLATVECNNIWVLIIHFADFTDSKGYVLAVPVQPVK